MQLPAAPRPDTTAKLHEHFIPNFEAHSLLLMAMLVVVLAAGAHAQTPASAAAERNSPPSRISPQTAASIPANSVSGKDVDAAFDRADSNRDGKLDRREAENFPAVAQRFDRIDSNHDSFVSREELKKTVGY